MSSSLWYQISLPKSKSKNFFVIYGRDNIPCLYFFYLDSRRRKHDQIFLDPPYTSKSSDPMPDWKIARFATSGRACMVNHCPQMMKWRPPLMGSLDPSLHHQLFGQSHYASLLSSLGSFIYLPKHQSMLELQYSMKLTKKEIRGRMFQKLKYTVLFIKVEYKRGFRILKQINEHSN